MQIKRLFPGDDTTAVARLCAEVQALHAAAEPHRYKQPGRRFVAETARWFASLLPDHDCFILLGTVEGEAVAYASAALIRNFANIYQPAYLTLYVDQFGVTERQRGHGYGRLLLDELIEIGRSNRADNITLDVQAFNAGAIGFYRRCGFTDRRHRMVLALADEAA
ncbi:MAG: GNAT family N-acetyltransferase [Caldilineae bacterium]|nr:GNAT family N-acetyltransferase [Anaerolineae bacterium]MCB0199682.1 GNAT family N-acetyltransferase [Anaerolineae bacterium]MCB0204439.1 GNAT family N-acetyltransferase [Anaerolineae bacterium]MCB0252961.1 GNAT family N-acetyltransferase [Anaerolineae bacterium]MCB9155190.1 GNAT family N-acetyltransferase [Caldilineae bacterium]